MAINFLKEPEEASPIENGGICYFFEGTELMSTPQKFRGKLILGQNYQPSSEERNLFFSYGSSIGFREMAFVTAKGGKYTIPFNALTSNRPSDWSFIVHLAKYYLGSHFSFELSGQQLSELSIEAKTNSEEYQIVTVEPPYLSSRFQKLAAAHESKPRKNYFFAVEVFFRELGQASFRSIGTEILTKTSQEIDPKVILDGRAEVDVTDLLAQAIEVIQPTSNDQSQIIAEYYVTVRENFQYYQHEWLDSSHGRFTAKSAIKRLTKQLLRSSIGGGKTESLSLVLFPQELIFSSDPINFQLKSRIFLDTPAVKSIWQFKLPALETIKVNQKQRPVVTNSQKQLEPLWPDGKALEFNFSDQSVKLWPVEDPDGSGQQFPAKCFTITEISPYVQANYKLTKHFEIQEKEDSLVFQARQAGPTFNLSGNKFLKPLSLGVDQADRPNFRFLFEIFFCRSDQTSFSCIFSSQIAQDTPYSGLARINISSIIDAFLDHDVHPIRHEEPHLCQKSTGVFFVQFAEIYGQQPQVQKLFKSAHKSVLKGSFWGSSKPPHLLKMLAPAPQDPQQDRFLKNSSAEEFIHEKQPLKLFFVNTRTENTQLRLTTRTECVDGSFHMSYSGYCDSKLFSKICFSTNIAVSQAVKQRCWIENQTEQRVSQEYVFHVNQEYLPLCRFFAYVSSLGALETFSTREEGGQFFEVLHEITDRETHTKAKAKIQYNNRIKHTFKVTTGWQTRAEFDRSADFFRSDQRFIIEDGELKPIIITTKKAGERLPWKHLQQTVFEYQYAED